MCFVFTRMPGESSLGRLGSWLLRLCGVVYVPLVEFMYFLFTRMPGESSLGRLRSWLLCLCGVVYVLWWILCTLHFLPCQVRAPVGDSCLCCCVCVE